LIVRTNLWKLYILLEVTKGTFNMDEGNEVLVCASEYVKGRPVFKHEKPNVTGICVHDFAV